MKVIGISGSPKLKGFTNRLLARAIEGAKSQGADIDTIMLNELEFDPCQECLGCGDTGECVVPDDMKPLYEKILSADGLIIASPIYFGTVSAQLKMMIDRLSCLWTAKFVLKKDITGSRARSGAFICVAGEDRIEYFDSAKKVIKNMFATINVKYKDELFVGGLNHLAADSPKREDAAGRAFRLGASLIK